MLIICANVAHNVNFLNKQDGKLYSMLNTLRTLCLLTVLSAIAVLFLAAVAAVRTRSVCPALADDFLRLRGGRCVWRRVG